MGRFLGEHIPDEFDPNYTQKDYSPDREYIAWYHLGYDDGYCHGNDAYNAVADKKLRSENALLKGELVTLSKTKEDMRAEYDFIDKICKKYDTQDKTPE